MGTATADVQALKDRHRATWAAGDYEAVADLFVLDIGRYVVDRVGVDRECEVLDVATGTGTAAIPAAAAGARVLGVDLTPELLAVARSRAREAGVDVEWVQGDAEDLPFEDGRFDVVLSTLGVQFAPRHAVAAAELARVCRPGGRIGLANWTPGGFIGQVFRTIAPYLPPLPDYASPPPRWGSEDHVEELFAGAGVTLEFERRTVDVRHDSPAAFIDFMAANYGPLLKARDLLAPQGRWEDLRADLVGVAAGANTAGDGGFHTASEYLVVIAHAPA